MTKLLVAFRHFRTRLETKPSPVFEVKGEQKEIIMAVVVLRVNQLQFHKIQAVMFVFTYVVWRRL
jgi:hypothetical protein